MSIRSSPYHRFRFALYLLAMMLTGMHAAAHAETLKIGGSGGALATMRLLAEAFQNRHAQHQIVIVPNLGSSGGVKATIDGAIDMGLSAHPLKTEEREAGVRAMEYARSPFVFVTRNTSLNSLSVSEIARIYAGATQNWPDGERIRLVLRPTNDSDTQLLSGISDSMKHIMTQALAQKGMVIAATDQDSVDTVERLPGAFGTSTLAQISAERRNLRILPVNQVVPSPANIASGRYPFYKTMYIILKNPSPLALEFIRFVQSTQGRSILESHGYWIPTRTP